MGSPAPSTLKNRTLPGSIVPALPALVLVASSAIARLSNVELEEAYWDCEFLASEVAIDLSTAAACSEIFESLKATRFQSDFRLFLSWWSENKERKLSERRDALLREN